MLTMCDMRTVSPVGRGWGKGSVAGDDGGSARGVGDGLAGDEPVGGAEHQESVPGGVGAGGVEVAGREGLLDARGVEKAEQGQFKGCQERSSFRERAARYPHRVRTSQRGPMVNTEPP